MSAGTVWLVVAGYVAVAFLVGAMLHHLGSLDWATEPEGARFWFAAFWLVCFAAMAFGYAMAGAWRLAVLATRAPAEVVLRQRARREARREALQDVERMLAPREDA